MAIRLFRVITSKRKIDSKKLAAAKHVAEEK
jgi:hypothetical protein